MTARFTLRLFSAGLLAAGLFTTGCDESDDAAQNTGTQGADTNAQTTGTGTGTGDATGAMTGTNPGDACGSFECNAGSQDCTPGLKCTPYRCDPQGCCTDSTKCTPVSGVKSYGEDCYRDGVAGVDDCAPGLYCMPNGDSSGGSGPGDCMQLWIPPAAGIQHHCDQLGRPGEHCFNFNGGSMPVCLPACDPLAQDCAEGEGCYLGLDNFICADPALPMGQNGQAGAGCDTEQACNPGLLCADASINPACNFPCTSVAVCGCCAAACNLASVNPNEFCGVGEQCSPVFATNPVPGTENVGVCVIPK